MPSVEVKPVRMFTRDDPCTKVHLWNAFMRGGHFIPRAVVEVRGEIGENAPKYLMREGYATLITEGGIDYYRLTPAGTDWLIKGTRRYLELHPEKAADCVDPPRGGATPRQRITRGNKGR